MLKTSSLSFFLRFLRWFMDINPRKVFVTLNFEICVFVCSDLTELWLREGVIFDAKCGSRVLWVSNDLNSLHERCVTAPSAPTADGVDKLFINFTVSQGMSNCSTKKNVCCQNNLKDYTIIKILHIGAFKRPHEITESHPQQLKHFPSLMIAQDEAASFPLPCQEEMIIKFGCGTPRRGSNCRVRGEQEEERVGEVNVSVSHCLPSTPAKITSI